MQAAGQTSHCVPQGAEENAKPDEPDWVRRGPGHSKSRTSRPRPAKAGGNSSDNQDITDELVQAALVSALQSREFQSAPQLRAFLGFVVRATLDREQEKVKGYTIAVEALGRPEDFNPVTDPIVRVEAARLRRRLEKYYTGSGADDPVRILIPKGSYAPEFCSAPLLKETEKPSAGVLTFQEGGKTFTSATDDLLEDAATASGASTAEAQEAGTRMGLSGGKTGPVPSRLEGAGPLPPEANGSQNPAQTSWRSVPLVPSLLFGGTCFLAGYFLALLLAP
ncbi:hypothetical protein [Roseibium sp.]|uniref:hypothetical protein n=1 Tax=Roseibium sp. TaxID=1936156 RepID=UPI003BAFB08E